MAIVHVGTANADYRASALWFSGKSEKERVVLQASLILLGHYVGLVDGIFGTRTFEALLGYEASTGLDGDGVLTREEETALLTHAANEYESYGFIDDADARAGLLVPIPKNVFTRSSPARWGTRWVSDNEGIELETLAVPETDSSFEVLHERLRSDPRKTITYNLYRDSFFVLSGELTGRKFYAAFVRLPGVSRGFSISWRPNEDKVGRVLSVFLSSMIEFPDVRNLDDFEQQEPGVSSGPSAPELPQVWSGTGFAVSTDGGIVTNYHVVDGCKRIEVVGVGRAILVSGDGDIDLAVVRVASRLPAAAVLQADPIELGQAVVALGFPLSDLMGNALTVSPGVVASLSGLAGDSRTFTVSANIQPGNSGGPILDLDGNVVGVAVAKLDEVEMLREAGTTAGPVGFAITTDVILDFLSLFEISVADTPVRTDGTVQKATARGKGFTYQILCEGGGGHETYRVTGIQSSDVLNMRAGPGTQYPIVAELPPSSHGVEIEACERVTGYGYRWCRATWQKRHGWLSACCVVGETTGRPPE